MSPDTELIEKGIRVHRLGLIDQSLRHLELYEKYSVVLKQYGWTDALTTEFADAITLVRSERAAAIEARTVSKDNRDREQAAVTNSKAFKRRIVHAAEDLHADRQISAHVLNGIVRSGKLRRSSTLIAGYLTDIRPHVKEAALLFDTYFGGESSLDMLDGLVAELDAAQGIQEANYKLLPLETQKVYEAKGRLLMLIEKMNRIAKIAFDGDAAMIGLFNKDLINRARKTRRAASTVEPVGEAIEDKAGDCEGEKIA